MNIYLIRKAAAYLAGQAFRKAHRNERGEMELRVNRGYRTGSYLGLLLGISLLLMQMLGETEAEDAALISVGGDCDNSVVRLLVSDLYIHESRRQRADVVRPSLARNQNDEAQRD